MPKKRIYNKFPLPDVVHTSLTRQLGKPVDNPDLPDLSEFPEIPDVP